MNNKLTLNEIIIVGLFAAIMAVLSQISIPLPFTSVPITLQVFGVVLIGTILGRKLGFLSLIIYLLLGAIGIPVFSGMSSGLGAIVGPTGGYLIGFPIMCYLIGFGVEKKNNILFFVLAFIGVLIDYAFGVIQLSYISNLSLSTALVYGFYPFIAKDIVMVFLAAFLGLQIRKRLVKSLSLKLS
ncbi:biotin transporter BioY [Clostridium hydrogeniformans]|uniref:biotin transporter BioY n=1 Tax=Clostridium hydrogeniformans TaxID=349933 RepID=UPI000487AC3F|nr:biotin transporter BioY [Clostridium hydrogeniformans]